MKTSRVFNLSLLFLVLASCSVEAKNPLPPDVSERVGRGQAWIYHWTIEQYKNLLETRDFIWNNAPDSAQGGSGALSFPDGSFSGFYVPVTRVPVAPHGYGTVGVAPTCGVAHRDCPLGWFQANHPSWLVLKHDQATPAYQFNDPAWLPLDISNPDVQSWIESNWLLPALSAGYQGISIDNVTARNDFDEEGVCSVAVIAGDCASNGGTWKRLYSGNLHDKEFVAKRVAWLERMTRFAHAHNAATTANVTYDPEDEADTARLISTVDIWYDEDGFNGSNPARCQVGGGTKFKIFDENWIRKVSFINGLNRGAGHPMVQEAAMCPLDSPDRHVVEYAMSSYYMTKTPHTYIVPYFSDQAAFEDQSAGGAWPDFTYRHGKPVDASPTVTDGLFKRAFADLLALLNPSSGGTASYELSGVYHDFAGSRYAGRITLQPRTGLTLLPGEPPR